MIILIVEESRLLHEAFQDLLGQEHVLLHAINLAEAECLWKQKQECIEAVILDGQLPQDARKSGHRSDTVALARRIREEGFGGPMVAYSGCPDIQVALLDAGCDRDCPKPALFQSLVEALTVPARNCSV